MSRFMWLAMVLASAMTLACSDDAGTSPAEPVASVAVAPTSGDLMVGDDLQLDVTLRDRDQRPLHGRMVTWSSSTPRVAIVSSSGQVTARDSGTATIMASSEGKQGTAQLQVSWSQAPVASITLDRTVLTLAEGDTTGLRATLRDADGRPLTGRVVTWTSADPTVASVTAAGVVTGIRAHSTTIEASAEGRAARAEVTVFAQGLDLVYSGSPTLTGGDRLYVQQLGGAARLVLPPDVLPGWNLTGAAVSPDGQRIAFSAQLGGEVYIYVVNMDGTGLRKLTTGGREGSPSWSPDGTKLAHVRNWDIWVMKSDGSEPVDITSHLGFLTARYSPAWSPAMPGGSRIAFADGDPGRSRIVTIQPDGSDVREVTTTVDWADSEPAWSPDGARIVFTRESTPGGADIWVVDATGGNATPLVSLRSIQANPAWSPDGRLIAFSSLHEPGAYAVYTMWSDGTNVVRRTGEGFVHPAWRTRR